MMPQITSITSEALQATIRRLLPSQQGFGDDLQATNLITPIIDLTPSAEGSEFRVDLQSALAFGSNTFTEVSNTTNTTVETGTGFFRVTGNISVRQESSANSVGNLFIRDGSSNKEFFQLTIDAGSEGGHLTTTFDKVIFLRSQDSLGASASNSTVFISICTRQVANSIGELVNPSGFQPQ
jgi:hypothetical protein